ncbi:MAG: type IV secretory system conjugative DNA transfer family protein [Clostridiales bacterium]|nr:type IV secretory system conjugative DNA transfer family protein [Clostridiales bacterium]
MKTSNVLLHGYENTRLVHYTEMDSLSNVVAYEDLPKQTVVGVLKGNRYVDGKLMQLYSTSENHVGVIAATRLGKTTSYVVPTILSFAMQKTKRSMLISDPKGELYRRTAATLRAQGYNVKLLNFRDYLHSECWNPLTPIFRKYRMAVTVADEVRLVETENGLRNEFRGVVYDDQRELDGAVELARAMMMDEVGNDIDTIGAMFMATESLKDPYWDEAARETFKAFLWAMLEDSDKKDNPITEDTYSFSTILSLQLTIRSGKGMSFEDGGYFTERDRSSRAYQIVKDTLIDNGDTTRACILAVFNTRIAMFRECAMRLITSCNSFEVSELTDGPTAVFIDYRDELKVHYQIISLFIQDAYRYLIEQANDKDEGKLDVPFYFILDEFGNFPAIKDFETTISACAGRNIFFILIIQSYAQLNNVYGAAVAEIIRDNLNMHVFMGSNNPETLEAFSRECGQKTRISPLSALNGNTEEIDHYQIETIPIVPRSMLAHFDAGECIVTEANSGYVLFTKLERYYLLREMNDLPLSSEKEYKCSVNPFDKRYTYVIKQSKSPFDYDF